MMDRRTFSLFAGSLALGQAAWAADEPWPQRPITLVVPFSAGSIVDVQARMIARGLAARLGQPIVIDNKVGVSGSLGADVVARAAPDGYTLLIGTQGTQGTNSALYKTIRYDPVKDFAAVHGLLGNANVLVTNPATKFRDVKSLVEAAKANPGKIAFASGGVGTAGHLCLELLQTATGARFNHVPYKSTNAAQVDLISGTIDALFDFVLTAGPHIKSGRMTALAVTSTKRLSALPDVPTMGEAGFAAADALSWGGVFAPARTPASIVQRLSDELDAVMKSPEVKASLEAAASFPLDMPHETFQPFVEREASKWREVIRKAGVKLD
jgi:tripartite-type tricarboxylate transporter receptor subunit TctC